MSEMDFSRLFAGSSPALANLSPLQPINFATGGNFSFQPLAQVTPVSSHPEAIAMGIGQAVQDVAKGYFAAQQQKKQDAKDEEERKRKNSLEERRMKLDENKFDYEKELKDRLASVGAEKFPGESIAQTSQMPQAPEDQDTASPTPEMSKTSGQLRSIGKYRPEAFADQPGPFGREKYSREINTFRDYTGEPSTSAPAPGAPVQVVPKPLSANPPGPIPAVADGGIFSQTPESSAVRNPLADLKTVYDATADKVKRFAELERISKAKYDQASQSGASTAGIPGVFSNLRETFSPTTKSEEKIVEKPTVPPTQASIEEKDYPAAQWEQLRQATAVDSPLSPALRADFQQPTKDISTDKTPALSPTLKVPDKQQTYPLDLSKMYDIEYTETPQAAQTSKAPQAGANMFEIPERPKANEIPRDFTTRNYQLAREEQAKNYGFYYEPMGKIETHKDINGNLWYKVVRDPEKASVIEQKLGRLETMKQRYDKYQLQQQNTIDREQTKFYSNPDVKAFTAPNGMRQSFARFVKDYDAILKNPEASGISDIGLLDMFGRAEGGGRITEGQAALALRSVGILDAPDRLIQKLQGGARLSQNQRDQMLRVIAEDHAAQANLANQQIDMVRTKLQRQGITDEEMLPQKFIVPITKWDYEEKTKEARALNTQLQLQKSEAQKNNDKATVDQINEQLMQLKEEMDPMYKMAKRIGVDKDGNLRSGILNSYEIEHSPQGWAGGAVATFQQQEP